MIKRGEGRDRIAKKKAHFHGLLNEGGCEIIQAYIKIARNDSGVLSNAIPVKVLKTDLPITEPAFDAALCMYSSLVRAFEESK